MTYDTWKQTDTLGEKLHADDDAVEAMRRDAAEARASDVLRDPAGLKELVDSGAVDMLTLTRLACAVWEKVHHMPSSVKQYCVSLCDEVDIHYLNTLTDDEIRAYIRDERERDRLDTEE